MQQKAMANIFATGDLAIEVDPYGNGGGRAVEERERERERERDVYFFFFLDTRYKFYFNLI